MQALDTHWPTQAWPTSTPEEEGMDGAMLAALDSEFAAGAHGLVTGMFIIRNGKAVYERSFAHDFQRMFVDCGDVRGPRNYFDADWHPFYKGGHLHTMQSVTKSITALLIGIAIGRGELNGVHSSIAPLFASDFKFGVSDPRQFSITLHHLLTMTAGIKWDERAVAYTDPANSCVRMERSDDWVQFVLDQPMEADPGSSFVYSSGVSQLLSHVIVKATGKHADEFATEHLFRPLGIHETHWKRTPTGLCDTEGGLYLTAHDLAKIGHLMLNDGQWEGRRVLPEGWVAASTQPLLESGIGGERAFKYSNQWWMIPHANCSSQQQYAYAALGYGGQRLIVVPRLQLIAVFTGWNIYGHPEFSPCDALDRVLAAVTDTATGV
jgi:CubicO group peptidase (beta-lactamase class C family)